MGTNDYFENNINYAKSLAKSYIIKYGNFMDTEDIEQTCLIGLFKASKSYDKNKKTTFKTYSYVIIKNEILMLARRELRYNNKTVLMDNNRVNELRNNINASNDYDKVEIKDIINGIDSKLGGNDIYNMLLYKKHTQKELAEQYNIHPRTMSRHLQRVKADIKQELEGKTQKE